MPSDRLNNWSARATKLIFATSFGFMDATLKVAGKHPSVFEHATGYKRANNVSTYSTRDYEGRYIQGQIAAKMSKTGVIGYIGSFPIPQVIANINATTLGAQSVRPDMKVKIIWVANTPGSIQVRKLTRPKHLPTKVPMSCHNILICRPRCRLLKQRRSTPSGSFRHDQFQPHSQLTADTDYWVELYKTRRRRS